MIRLLSSASAAGVFCAVAWGSAFAQDCQAGPQCRAADARAQEAIAGWEPLLSSASVHIASEVAYCTNMAVVDAAHACELEFASMGQQACAAIAAEQVRESRLSAQSAFDSAAQSAASSNWAPNCSSLGAGTR